MTPMMLYEDGREGSSLSTHTLTPTPASMIRCLSQLRTETAACSRRRRREDHGTADGRKRAPPVQ